MSESFFVLAFVYRSMACALLYIFMNHTDIMFQHSTAAREKKSLAKFCI